MAIQFVVEDGTGLVTATSYISLADLKQLWENAGYSYATLTDDQLSVLLNNATLSLDGQYGDQYPGTRQSKSQALDWPRQDAYDQDGYIRSSTLVPVEVERALSEMAYAVNSGVDVDPVYTDAGNLKKESVAVEGAVRESKEYFEGSTLIYPRIPKVDNALLRLLGSTSMYGAMDVVRV